MRFVYDSPPAGARRVQPGRGHRADQPHPAAAARQERRAHPAAFAIAAYDKALEPKRPEIVPGGHFDAYVQRLRRLKPPSADLVP